MIWLCIAMAILSGLVVYLAWCIRLNERTLRRSIHALEMRHYYDHMALRVFGRVETRDVCTCCGRLCPEVKSWRHEPWCQLYEKAKR